MKASAYRPFEVDAGDRVAGLFVIGAILLFLAGFLLPFVQRLSADSGIPFHTLLDQTYGIAPQATVSLRGVAIGQVTDVAIIDSGQVRVDIALSQDYEVFYTQGSRLAVDGNIGVNSILTGSGLILTPGEPGSQRLANDSMIPADPPQGLSSVLEGIDIAALANQVTQIVADVSNITAEINSNQDKIYRTLDNLETVSGNLASISAQMPVMVASLETSLSSLNGTLEGVDSIVQTTDTQLKGTFDEIKDLTRQANRTLAETETLMRTTRPAMQQLPRVLMTTDVALQSFTRLSDQMSQSWLLGGSDDEVLPVAAVPSAAYPQAHDNALYVIQQPIPASEPAEAEPAGTE